MSGRLAPPGPRATFGLVLAAVLLAGLVIFVVQNFAVVEIRFLRWRFHVRLAWAILIAAGLGGFPAFLLGWLRSRRS